MTQPRGGHPGPHPAPALAGLRLVLVEDDDFLREALEGLVASAGARVTPFADAETAVAGLAVGADADLVLTDIHLPGRSGLWLAEWCAAERPGLPVVLISADLPPGGSVFPPSVRRYVRKPFDPAALVEILAAAALPPGDGG